MNTLDKLAHNLWNMRDSDAATFEDFRVALEKGFVAAANGKRLDGSAKWLVNKDGDIEWQRDSNTKSVFVFPNGTHPRLPKALAVAHNLLCGISPDRSTGK